MRVSAASMRVSAASVRGTFTGPLIQVLNTPNNQTWCTASLPDEIQLVDSVARGSTPCFRFPFRISSFFLPTLPKAPGGAAAHQPFHKKLVGLSTFLDFSAFFSKNKVVRNAESFIMAMMKKKKIRACRK
jgi:hypothetical protein